MIRIREIDHLVLRVSDLEKMLKFYCQGLGCSVERRLHAMGLVVSNVRKFQRHVVSQFLLNGRVPLMHQRISEVLRDAAESRRYVESEVGDILEDVSRNTPTAGRKESPKESRHFRVPDRAFQGLDGWSYPSRT